MNGAESLVHTLLASGVDTCFANPGTSEMHFVAALDRVPGMRCVLGLFEGVVTGAADGYARMAGKPAATLLHCGPGLANGLANLHNARRARVPIVNIVGDQATYHRPLDAPLTADTEGWARPVSGWTRTATHAATVGADAAQAVQAAMTAPGQIATLILPSDASWDDGGVVAAPLPPPPAAQADAGDVEAVAPRVRSGEPAMLILSGRPCCARTLAVAGGICAATGARMLAQTSNTRMERGAGRMPIERVPYPVDLALKALAGLKHIVLVGAAAPGRLLRLSRQTRPHVSRGLHRPRAGPPRAGRPGRPLRPGRPAWRHPAAAPRGPSGPSRDGRDQLRGHGADLAALMPEGAIVVDESVTFGRGLFPLTRGAAPHDWLQLTGGAIGDGLPLSTGAAVGAPGRRVVTLQADGSAMYTVQALWTQAREGLDVTTVILSNRKYAILLGELANVGANPGRTALDMMDLGNPDLDWCRIGAGMGVESARAETMEQFNDLMAASTRQSGPFLIELMT